MQHTVSAYIRPGEKSGFIAECPQLHAVTQGANLDEAVANLHEVVVLALDGEDLAELGLEPNPVILASLLLH